MGKADKATPSQQDLHAYIDDELTPEQRMRVEAWLEENPDERRELIELKLRENLLRSVFATPGDQISGSAEYDGPTSTPHENDQKHPKGRVILWVAAAGAIVLAAYLIAAL